VAFLHWLDSIQFSSDWLVSIGNVYFSESAVSMLMQIDVFRFSFFYKNVRDYDGGVPNF
jgi:hypothetical protein